MKKLYFLLFVSLSIFSINNLFAGNKDGRIYMYARLSASQEVPAVNSKAKGLVTFILAEDYKTMTIYGVFDSLSGPVTNCHFHTGAFGVNGVTVLNLLPLVKGNQISGTVTVTKAILAAINIYGIYINVHTTANSTGEMRGQVYLDSDLHFGALLQGANEIPTVTTTALGLGSFVLSSNYTRLEYKVLVTGLSGPITGAHLHFGDANKASGTVAYTLTSVGNTLTGFLDVSPAFVDSLFNTKIYVNVHTTANPGGEIRAQVGFSSLVAFDIMANGANEVPAKVSSGKAIALGWMTPELDSLNYLVLYDSIVPTLAHFHPGAVGVNGSALIGLSAIAGTNAYSARVAIKPDTLAKILRGDIYLNIHTATNSGGEIRGQTNTSVREGLVANLCGKQEVPVVNGTAIGAGFLSIDRNKTNGHVELVTNGLTSNATLGHIHIGAKGISGSAVINLGITGGATGNGATGFFSISRITFADTLINGLGYYNVHTTANGGGEIRGQIGKTLETICLPVGTFELNGEQLSVKVFPNPISDAVNLVFDSNEAFDAQVVIADLLGRPIISKKTDILRGANQVNVSVNNMPNGIYFVQLKNNSRIFFTEKIIKN